MREVSTQGYKYGSHHIEEYRTKTDKILVTLILLTPVCMLHHNDERGTTVSLMIVLKTYETLEPVFVLTTRYHVLSPRLTNVTLSGIRSGVTLSRSTHDTRLAKEYNNVYLLFIYFLVFFYG